MFELSNFHAMKISIASPDKIRSWSHGEVTKGETINYRTTKPEKDGLFCEKIFGPTKDYECSCGKYKRQRYKGIICDRCGVEVTSKTVRRERMGHIELAAPVSHIWFFKINPSAIGTLLELNQKELEKVLYYTDYIVLDPGKTDLQKKDIINDRVYAEKEEQFGENSFKAMMGAEAIKILLSEIDLEKEVNDLKTKMNESKGQKKDKITKKLEIVEAFYKSKNKPEWMILDCIPVIPPDLRPMIQLDGGRYATNDLNDLYRRVINRNIRLKKHLEIGSPSVIIRNEKRLLQEAVDSLFDNGKHGKPVISGNKNRELKSIYAALKGKQGRFRQNLLGKRVDYSGRAVIVIGPELKMYQCGLPKHMALELFKPFIMKKLQDENKTINMRSAKKMIDREHPDVYNALDEVIKEHPVLLNRAPTLHKLSIQAFEPVLVDGNAMKLHPLVCQGFNADFDGDQMAVHVPLSIEARAEARFLMLSTNNIVKPSDGKPIVTPQQDIVLGCYYLTIENPNGKGAGMIFVDEDEAIVAYQLKEVSLQAPIKVRKSAYFNGELITGVVKTTVGQIIFNQVIPQDIGFVDRTKKENALAYEITGDAVGKDRLGKIVAAVYKYHGNTETAKILDEIKSLGYKYSTLSGITMNLFDMDIPKERDIVIAETQKIAEANETLYRRGLMSLSDKVNKNIKIWNEATEKVSKAVRENLDTFNPIKMIAVSKARTNPNQLNQVCGMRGIITATSAEKIDIPIKSNYRLGLSPFEYFTSARGGRKGLADTALKTANAGYMTRRLVDVAQNVVVTELDCFANRDEKISGTPVSKVEVDSTLVISLADRISGRVAVKDVVDPETGEIIVESNQMITSDQAKAIEDAGIKTVEIRTILNCKAKIGCCAKCYGKDMSQERLVSIGEAVGVIAAQSVGEPGTQLTMKNFHTGGVATASDITTGLPRVEELFEARKPKGLACISRISGTVSIKREGKIDVVTITPLDNKDKKPQIEELPFGSLLIVQEGQVVSPGTQITAGSIYPQDILHVQGIKACQEYLINSIMAVYSKQDVKINPKHLEIIVNQMLKKVKVEDPGDSDFLPGTYIDINTHNDERERLYMEDKRPAQVSRVLLGITKASLYTESFLSAASFQETSAVLTSAAIRGKVDYLQGLKENVLIGKLIPAGTGIRDYRNVTGKYIKPQEEKVVNNFNKAGLDIESVDFNDEETDFVDIEPQSKKVEEVDNNLEDLFKDEF